MRLQKITLENFQGIKSVGFDFGGHSASIYGDNATGKTTIFNALTWILFDKASTGAKNFTPKTRTADGESHFLNHSVEASFRYEDGRIVSFKKIYHEIYKKKRGSATEEFSGHTTNYFIDGVPSDETEFSSTILGGVENSLQLKILTIPTYFSEELAWEQRRGILLSICGDVSDEDVINSDNELSELNRLLLIPGTTDRYYTVDDYRKIAAAKKTEINKQIQDIPGRIDEANLAIPELPNLTSVGIDNKLIELRANQQKLSSEKNDALNDVEMQIYKNKLAELNLSLVEAKSAYIKKIQMLSLIHI